MTEYFNYIVGIIGTIGVIYTIIGHYNKKLKRISFKVRTHELVGETLSKVSDLKIFFDSKEVSNLYRTDITFWNSGKEKIDGEEIVDKKIPIKGNILKAVVLKQPNQYNGIKIFGNAITFDFLKPNEGAIIQVLHKEANISIENDCIFKDGKFEIDNDPDWETFNIQTIRQDRKKNFTISIIILFLYSSLFFIKCFTNPTGVFDSFSSIIDFALCILSFIGLLFALLSTLLERRVPKALITNK